MIQDQDNSNLPPDPEPRAFVLRVRPETFSPKRPMVIDVDDVNSSTSWHFTSLEAAFEKIRVLIEQRTVPGGRLGNMH